MGNLRAGQGNRRRAEVGVTSSVSRPRASTGPGDNSSRAPITSLEIHHIVSGCRGYPAIKSVGTQALGETLADKSSTHTFVIEVCHVRILSDLSSITEELRRSSSPQVASMNSWSHPRYSA